MKDYTAFHNHIISVLGLQDFEIISLDLHMEFNEEQTVKCVMYAPSGDENNFELIDKNFRVKLEDIIVGIDK